MKKVLFFALICALCASCVSIDSDLICRVKGTSAIVETGQGVVEEIDLNTIFLTMNHPGVPVSVQSTSPIRIGLVDKKTYDDEVPTNQYSRITVRTQDFVFAVWVGDVSFDAFVVRTLCPFVDGRQVTIPVEVEGTGVVFKPLSAGRYEMELSLDMYVGGEKVNSMAITQTIAPVGAINESPKIEGWKN